MVVSTINPINNQANIRSSSNVDPARIQAVIDKYGNGKSPLTAQMIIESSQKTGVPEDFYLVMAISESSMATAGRAVFTNNPMNVGNVDSGAHEHQSNIEAGLDRFGNLIKNEYFRPDETPSLDVFISRDFRRPSDGARYMSNPDTRGSIPKLTNEVRQMLGLPPGTSLIAQGLPSSNLDQENDDQFMSSSQSPLAGFEQPQLMSGTGFSGSQPRLQQTPGS